MIRTATLGGTGGGCRESRCHRCAAFEGYPRNAFRGMGLISLRNMAVGAGRIREMTQQGGGGAHAAFFSPIDNHPSAIQPDSGERPKSVATAEGPPEMVARRLDLRKRPDLLTVPCSVFSGLPAQFSFPFSIPGRTFPWAAGRSSGVYAIWYVTNVAHRSDPSLRLWLTLPDPAPCWNSAAHQHPGRPAMEPRPWTGGR